MREARDREVAALPRPNSAEGANRVWARKMHSATPPPIVTVGGRCPRILSSAVERLFCSQPADGSNPSGSWRHAGKIRGFRPPPALPTPLFFMGSFGAGLRRSSAPKPLPETDPPGDRFNAGSVRTKRPQTALLRVGQGCLDSSPPGARKPAKRSYQGNTPPQTPQERRDFSGNLRKIRPYPKTTGRGQRSLGSVGRTLGREAQTKGSSGPGRSGPLAGAAVDREDRSPEAKARPEGRPARCEVKHLSSIRKGNQTRLRR